MSITLDSGQTDPRGIEDYEMRKIRSLTNENNLV